MVDIKTVIPYSMRTSRGLKGLLSYMVPCSPIVLPSVENSTDRSLFRKIVIGKWIDLTTVGRLSHSRVQIQLVIFFGVPMWTRQWTSDVTHPRNTSEFTHSRSSFRGVVEITIRQEASIPSWNYAWTNRATTRSWTRSLRNTSQNIDKKLHHDHDGISSSWDCNDT